MSDQDPVQLFDAADSEMEAAGAKARETFKYFWRELSWERRRIVPGLDLACVKVAFAVEQPVDGQPSVEHMWVDDVDFNGRQISGTLVNSPNWINSVSEGDEVKVTLDELVDWMFAIRGKVYGGFTVNVMRSRMSPSDRREHDKAWDLDFGDSTTVCLVYFEPSKSGAHHDQEVAARRDHPMSLNMEASLRQALDNNPEMVNERDERAWTMLHREALAGNRNIVQVLLEYGADPDLTTPEGRTPLDLARALNWDETVEVLSKRPMQ